MFGSNCCFLICVQVSQEAGKVVWYSHLFKNFPQLVVIHMVKGFSIVSEAEVCVFLEFPCLFYDPVGGYNLVSDSSALSKSSLNIWNIMVHILLKPSLKDFEHYLASLWNEHNCMVVWAFFGIAFLSDYLEKEMATHSSILAWKIPWTEDPGRLQSMGSQRVGHDWATSLHFFQIGMKTDLFQCCGHCWVFPICWHIECSTFTASSFRIWNSSAGIPSPPLALFLVMLTKSHLTSHSRMSDSRWVTTPLWLSGSLRPFLYSSVYSCHLFLILLVLLGPCHFCPLLCPSLQKSFP